MNRIEKNIPIPANASARLKYPFGEMEVGDSIFLPNEPKGSLSRPSLAAHTFGKRNGKRFAARAENGGVRIWRTE